MQYIDTTQIMYLETDDVIADAKYHSLFAPLEISTVFYNHLNVHVEVIQRNGVPFRLPPSGKRDNVFVVQITHKLAKSVVVDQSNTFHHNQQEDKESEVLKSSIENAEQNAISRDKTFTTSYTFTRDEIVDNGGVLYLAQLDLTINTTNDTSSVSHPYSVSSARDKLIEAETDVNNTDRFGYSMYIISNDGSYTDKFINIGGNAFRVPSSKNNSLRDGVYVCSSGPVLNDAKRAMPRVTHYSFKDVSKHLKLYNSIDDALQLGDELASRDLELKRLTIQMKQMEHDHKMEKVRIDAEDQKRRARYDRLEYEREERLARDKEAYENRSQSRKDNSDLIKTIITFATLGLSIAALLAKNSK